MHAIVKRRKLDDEDKDVGHMNNTPLIGTIAYKVDFYDGTTEVIIAKMFYKNLLAQVDE